MVYKDTRNPEPSSEATTHVMKANKGKGTSPELQIRKKLRELGFPGYRLNWKGASGRPDIAYPGRKVAIFVNGCFWHRCPICNLPMPKSHVDFWEKKFTSNVERDDRKRRELESKGWKVITIWECQIKNDMVGIEKTLTDALSE